MCQADLPERVRGSFLPRVQAQHSLHDTLCWSGMRSASGIPDERRYLSIHLRRNYKTAFTFRQSGFIFFSQIYQSLT